MNSATKSILTHYGFAVLGVALMTLIRWPFEPLVGDHDPFILYFVAVALVARKGGIGPSVLAIILSAIAVAVWVLPPSGTVSFIDPMAWVGFLLFVIVSATVASAMLTLQKARSQTEQARIEQTKLLLYVQDVSHSLTQASTQQDMLDACAQATVRHLDGAFARIWALDESGKTLVLQASAGDSIHFDGPRSQLSEEPYRFLIDRIAKDRIPHLTNSIVDDLLVSDQEWARKTGLKAFAAYPLVVDDRLVGVIDLFSRNPLRAVTLEMMGSVASEIALAIERKHAQERLLQQREWMRVTLESIGDGMIATDVAGRVIMVNAAAEGLTGWSQSDALGLPLEQIFHIIDETTRSATENPAQQALASGMIVGLANHTLLIARDGSEKAIDDSAAPIRDAQGNVAGVVLIFRDVTERRESERRLQASEARKTAILETSLDAIVTIDEQGNVVEFNPAAERIFGYNRDDVIGRRMSELIIPPSLRASHEEGLEHFRRTGHRSILGRRIETSGFRSDGTEFPVELAVTQPSLRGTVVFTAHIRDISDRKAIERRRSTRLRVTEILAAGASIDQVMPKILQAVCEVSDSSFGAFWIIEDGANVLHCRSVWHESIPHAGRLATASKELVIHPGEDLPGRVWKSASPSWTRNLQDDRLAVRNPIAIQAGLRAALAFPIVSGDRVLAVLEFYSSKDRDADLDILEVLGSIAGQIGLFLLRTRAEESLRAGEERLRIALDAGKMGTWEWNIDTDSVHWSPTLEVIHGIEPGTFPGTFDAYRADMHPDDRPAVLASIQAALHQTKNHLLEYRIILPDGSIRWVEARANLFRDETGRPRNMVGVCSDITMRKQAEAERSRLISLIEHSPSFIGLADESQRVSFVNRAGLALVGLKLEDAPTTSIIDFFPEHEQVRVINQILPVLVRDGHWDGEVEFRHFETGKTIPVMWNVFTIREQGSDKPYFACVSTDITERKQAETEILRSEKQFHSLADSIPQLAWMARADGCIYWYNQRWYDYTGTTFEQMQGWGWRSVHDPELVDRVEATFRAALAGGVPWEDTFPIRRHDGAMRWHLSRAQPVLDADGRIVQWFGTNTDITERMLLEESLREVDRRKDEFLAMLAHELRNPLAPIRNALHLMKSSTGDAKGLEQERAMAERQVTHLARLVEDLMDVSRINTGKIELRKRTVELSDIVNDAVRSVASSIEERNHRLSVVLPETPILLEADPTRLEQILWNLLNNAIKYTDPGGEVELRVEPKAESVVIRVRDNGLGITPEVLPTVFDMFVQAGRHRGHSRGGLGIGLSLVKKLVGLHGGQIVARSEGAGRGSEFILELPAVQGVTSLSLSPAASKSAPNDVPTKRRRVLIVDDNEDAAKSLARLLTRLHGQEVAIAHDGFDAVALAVEFKPELVLLDIGLPGLDGFEVARRIRSFPDLHATTIVALTGWGQEGDRQKSRDAGFDRHFVKPLDPNLLEGLLADTLDPAP